MNDYFHLKTFASLVVVGVDAVAAATTALIARAKGERRSGIVWPWAVGRAKLLSEI